MSGKERVRTPVLARQMPMPGFATPETPRKNGNGNGNGHEAKKEISTRPFLIGRDIPAEEATGRQMNCEICNEPLLVDRVVIKRAKPRGSAVEKVKVISDLKCPNCGVRSSKKLMNGERPVKEYLKPLPKR